MGYKLFEVNMDKNYKTKDIKSGINAKKIWLLYGGEISHLC